MNRLAFLDRDGVINEDLGYLYRVQECRFVAGIFELANGLVGLGYQLVVVTNQSGIARGLFKQQDYHQLMAWIKQQFDKNQTPLAADYFCPHHPTEARLKYYQKDCHWRKPKPGMLLQALKDFDTEPGNCLLIGDSERDIEAAVNAGISQTFLFNPLGSKPNSQTNSQARYQVQHLSEVLNYVH